MSADSLCNQQTLKMTYCTEHLYIYFLVHQLTNVIRLQTINNNSDL